MYFTRYGRDTIQAGIINSKYSIISYVDSVGCTSCKLALNRWLKFMAELDTITKSLVPVHFFLNPSDKDEVIELFERNKFDYPVCLDESDSINILNKFPKDIFFQTFLLDKDNRVIAIGNPVLNPKIKDLYFNIISENATLSPVNKQILTTVSISKDIINLGDFSCDKTKEVDVFVVNTGKVPLVINDVITSCGCTTVEYPKEPVLPGKNIVLKVKYKAEHPEHFNKTITVYCNAENAPLPAFHVDSVFPFEVHSMANGRFIASGIYDNYRFCLLDSGGRVQSTFGEWPYRDEVEKNVSGMVRSQAYMFNIAMSPSKTKFIASLLSADILAFYQLENDSVHLIKEAILTYPEYEYRNNPTSYSGASRDAPMNYLSATCSEDYIYVLYSGKSFRENALASFLGNIIYVHTWSDDKLAVLKSDKLLGKICLAEDGKTMYAIAYDFDPVLVQFTLPQW